MDIKFKSIVLIFLFTLSGCTITHEYQWNEYKLTPDRLPPQHRFTAGKAVKVIKGKADSTRILLGEVGPHEYYASKQMLTNGLADHLAIELQNMNIKVNDAATKSLTITVNSNFFERGMWAIAATLNFTVEFADGKKRSFSVLNKSPASVDRLYDGVVARSVIAILEDSEVQAYINR